VSNHKISVSLILAVAGLATGVHAEPVRWFLEDVQFADGTSANGSFIFDADAGVDERYLEIDIVTSSGPAAAGARYRDPNPDSPGNETVLVAVPDDSLADFDNTTQLAMAFDGQLTNAGGIVGIDTEGFTAEGTCLPDDDPRACWSFSFNRRIVAGRVTSQAPERPNPRCDFNDQLATYKCFELITEAAPISWDQAKLRAAAREFLGVGGRLATPSSFGQTEFLQNSFAFTQGGLLLGGRCTGTDGRCSSFGDVEWISGEDPISAFFGWCPGEPNGDANGVLQISDPSFCFNDISGPTETFTTYFVEYDVANVIPRCFLTGPNATGNCYQIVLEDEVLTWDEARQRAESLKFLGIRGRLATITHFDEQQFIARNVKPVRTRGLTEIDVIFPSGLDRLRAGVANFGPSLVDDNEPEPVRRLSGRLAEAFDGEGEPMDACSPLTADSAAAVAGRIALVDRGTCAFVDKVFNAQQAGAIAVLIANNEGNDVFAIGGNTDIEPGSLIEIPSVLIGQDRGQALRDQIQDDPEVVLKSTISDQARPFIGARCIDDRCTSPTDFSWITGEPVVYTNWCATDAGGNEPNADPRGVLELFDNRYCWNDTEADAGLSRAFLVEYEIPRDGPLCFRSRPGANQSCYEWVETDVVGWNAAREQAASRSHEGVPGRLATVNSAEEMAFLAVSMPPLRSFRADVSNNYITIDEATPLNRSYAAEDASFGTPITAGAPISGLPVRLIDGTEPTGDGCEAATNAGAVAGRIALVDRGNCTFVQKVFNAQQAGAIAVIVVNVFSDTLVAMSGDTSTEPGSLITIPSMLIGQSDGQNLDELLAENPQLSLRVLPKSIYAPGGGLAPWIGGACEGGSCEGPADYAWISGESTDFRPWCPGEPNGDPDGVLQMFNSLICFNDETAFSVLPDSYLVEYPSDVLFSNSFERPDNPGPF